MNAPRKGFGLDQEPQQADPDNDRHFSILLGIIVAVIVAMVVWRVGSGYPWTARKPCRDAVPSVRGCCDERHVLRVVDGVALCVCPKEAAP